MGSFRSVNACVPDALLRQAEGAHVEETGNSKKDRKMGSWTENRQMIFQLTSGSPELNPVNCSPWISLETWELKNGKWSLFMKPLSDHPAPRMAASLY